jgi:predicted alternative tryptophan synthase beta-subunit
MELIKQEMCQEQYVDIPEEVQKAYLQYRPPPFTGHEIWKKHLIHQLTFTTNWKMSVLRDHTN